MFENSLPQAYYSTNANETVHRMTSAAYLVGRPTAPLEAPFSGTDKVFAGHRLDGQIIERGNFSHCTFANISFKEVTLNDVSFLDCVFLGCYFRQTDIQGTRFIGCRFVDCDFPKVAIRGCDFSYSKFRTCFIPFSELEHSLPQEPNLREDLARNLAVETASLGFPREARAYRMCQIRAREEHLKAAVKGASRWYRDHYDIPRRIGAALGLFGSVVNRYLWGYGQRLRVLVCNFVLLGLVVFPLVFYSLRSELKKMTGSEIGPLDIIYFSLQNMLPAGMDSAIRANSALTRGLVGLESLIAVIFAGLFVSYLFRSILHR